MRIKPLDTSKLHRDYIRAISFKELMKAAKQCAKGVMWKASAIEWMFRREERCAKLHRQLTEGTYRIQPYIYFNLYCPKHRRISSTKFTDRVVQRSLCNNGLYDLISNPLIYDNCACLKEKGTKFALDRFILKLRHYLRRNGKRGYVVNIDVSKYFDSTPHENLKEIVSRHISEGGFQERVFEIIDSFKDNRRRNNIPLRTDKVCGVGLGSQISQLLMLLYLNDLDHIITQKYHNSTYVRYMDDIIFLCETYEQAKKLKDVVEKFLNSRLLGMNSKSSITPLSIPILFLKVRISISDSLHIHLHLSRKTMRRQFEKLRVIFKKIREKRTDVTVAVEEYNSWFGSNFHKMSKRQKKLAVSKFAENYTIKSK